MFIFDMIKKACQAWFNHMAKNSETGRGILLNAVEITAVATAGYYVGRAAWRATPESVRGMIRVRMPGTKAYTAARAARQAQGENLAA